MKFQIKNRFNDSVQYECELSDGVAGRSYGHRLGFAIQKGVSSGADLSCADLRGADLSCADLSCADLRDADLRDADLRGADLRGADLRGAVLSGADLRDADLNDADLRGAVLSGADLRDADLNDADLSDADLRDVDLCDDDRVPKIQNIHSVVYDAASKPNALDMTSWHCGTTHCRAGWVVTLAGDGGKVLERIYGTALAAALIYRASDPKLDKVPNFYASNKAALADMKKMAEAEMARGAV